MSKTTKGAGDASQSEPTAITVTAVQSRRRAGYLFGPEPVTIQLADLTEEQAAAIASDPYLKVVPC